MSKKTPKKTNHVTEEIAEKPVENLVGIVEKPEQKLQKKPVNAVAYSDLNEPYGISATHTFVRFILRIVSILRDKKINFKDLPNVIEIVKLIPDLLKDYKGLKSELLDLSQNEVDYLFDELVKEFPFIKSNVDRYQSLIVGCFTVVKVLFLSIKK